MEELKGGKYIIDVYVPKGLADAEERNQGLASELE